MIDWIIRVLNRGKRQLSTPVRVDATPAAEKKRAEERAQRLRLQLLDIEAEQFTGDNRFRYDSEDRRGSRGDC